MKSLIQLVDKHKRMRPLMEIQDVYKLIYQSVLGLGHLLGNHFQAKNYLIDELNTLSPNRLDDLLIEDITIKNKMIRVNLRPFQEKNLPTDLLFEAMLLTEKNNSSKIDDFIRVWNTLVRLVEKGEIDLNLDELKGFTEKIKYSNYPIMHHSLIYNENYKPAYRVIDYEVFNKLIVPLIDKPNLSQ